MDDDNDNDEDDDIKDDEEVTLDVADSMAHLLAQLFNKKPAPATTEEEQPVWAPKKLVTARVDKDRVRCCTVILSLTDGNGTERSDGFEVAVTEDGWTIALAEKWSDFPLDVEPFHQNCPPHPGKRETDDEFKHRKFAMIDTVRLFKSISQNDVVSSHRCRPPFRVEPSKMNMEFIAGPTEGECHVDVDLAEQKRVQCHKVHRVNKKALLRSPASSHPHVNCSMISQEETQQQAIHIP